MKKLTYTDLKTGDVAAFRTSFNVIKPVTWLSTSIRYFAKIKHNHVGVIITTDKTEIYESIEGGFKNREFTEKLKEYDLKNIIILRPVYPEFVESLFRIETKILAFNTPYDVVGLLSQLVWNLTNVWVGKRREKAKSLMYCYESMGYLHRRSKVFRKWWKIKCFQLFTTKEFEQYALITKI